MVRVTNNAPLPTVWLNGGLCRIEDARISVLDRGFIYGDGIYEIIPVYGGIPLRPEKHIARLVSGLDAVSIDDPAGSDGWEKLITDLVAVNGGGDVSVYIQVTRGAPASRDHAFPTDTAPTVFAMCAPLPKLDPALNQKGVTAITREDTRWARCDIKSTSLIANVLLRQEAVNAGAAETILYHGDYITEGSASSVFAVIDGLIVTTPDGPEILPGTTRDLVTELATGAGLPTRARPLGRTELMQADEVWLCSSLREVLPVTVLDDTPVADGQPGPLFRQIYELYQDCKRRLPEQTA